MKRTLSIVSFVAALTLMAAFTSAGSGAVMRADIPFDFYVGDQLLLAGEYQFKMGAVGQETASNVAIRTKEGTVVALLITKPECWAHAKTAQVTFNHYSGKYFLSSVESPGYKASLKKTTLEKELMSQPDTEEIAMVLPLY